MESAAPTIADGLEACARAGATEVVVHPFFLAPGRHATDDIPRMVHLAAADHPGLVVRISEPTGSGRGIVDLILSLVGLPAAED